MIIGTPAAVGAASGAKGVLRQEVAVDGRAEAEAQSGHRAAARRHVGCELALRPRRDVEVVLPRQLLELVDLIGARPASFTT
jgi:hypothetical protein